MLRSWRRLIEADSGKMRERVKGTKLQKGLLVFTVILAGLYIAGGISFVVGWATGTSDWDANVLEGLIFTIVPLVAGTMVIFGIFNCQKSPRLGIGLVTVGSIAMAALWFWLAFILMPFAAVVIATAVMRSRNFVRRSAT